MPVGFQVWDATGMLVFDLTDRLTRIVSVISVPVGTSGSVQLPEGSPWWYSTPNGAATLAGSAYAPAISVDGSNVLSYGPNATYGTGQVDCTLVIGVY